jgi:hypothetical protein
MEGSPIQWLREFLEARHRTNSTTHSLGDIFSKGLHAYTLPLPATNTAQLSDLSSISYGQNLLELGIELL